MPLPNFLIIGAQKSATTWLAMNLRQHPSIFLPGREIHFFNRDGNYSRGVEWYKRYFDKVKDEKAIGEKTPEYLWIVGKQSSLGEFDNVHYRIYRTLPHVKLIVVLRNPVERAISAVNHHIRRGRISPLWNIDQVLVGRRQEVAERLGIITMGRYYEQLVPFLEYFDLSQVKILFFEKDIIERPEQSLQEICDFLGVNRSYRFGGLHDVIAKKRTSRVALMFSYYLPFTRPMIRRFARYMPWWRQKVRPSEKVVNELYRLYAEDNEKLFNLVGCWISSWQKGI